MWGLGEDEEGVCVCVCVGGGGRLYPTSNLPVLLILDGVESEFREPHVRLTFREAVQLFEHRSQFIRRSSDACLVRIFTYHSFLCCCVFY